MPLVLFLHLILLVEVVCGFLMTKKSPSPQATKIRGLQNYRQIPITSHAVLKWEMLDCSLQGTCCWDTQLQQNNRLFRNLCFAGVKIPSLGGRVKPNPGIRNHKGCTEECVWAKQPKQNQPPNPKQAEKLINDDCSILLLLLQSCCVHWSPRQCWGCGQLSNCQQGGPIRQCWSQLSCLRSLEWEFHCSCSADWGRCTSLMLNDFRQRTFCSGLCILDWSKQYSLLSCSYSWCVSTTPLRHDSHTGCQFFTRTDCTDRKKRTPLKLSTDCFTTTPSWTPRTCAAVGSLLHSQFCSMTLFSPPAAGKLFL